MISSAVRTLKRNMEHLPGRDNLNLRVATKLGSASLAASLIARTSERTGVIPEIAQNFALGASTGMILTQAISRVIERTGLRPGIAAPLAAATNTLLGGYASHEAIQHGIPVETATQVSVANACGSMIHLTVVDEERRRQVTAVPMQAVDR